MIELNENIQNLLEDIDILSTKQTVDILFDEQKRLLDCVVAEKENIIQAIKLVTQSIQNGGKVLLLGASSFARLSNLQMLEAQVNFGLKKDLLQNFMAGSNTALYDVEKEPDDSYDLGKADVLLNFVGDNDLIILLCNRQNLQYTCGVLDIAEQKVIPTILIATKNCSDLNSDVKIVLPFDEKTLFDVQSVNYTLAQKMILNTIFTASMSKLGKTYKNYLIDYKVNNQQTKNQAVEIISQITGVDEQTAFETLKKCKFRTKVAIVMLKHNVDTVKAIKLLKKQNGILRKVID